MFLVRYVALVASTIWVGGMAAAVWIVGTGPPGIAVARQLAYPCGAAVLVALFVLKFVGPPPHAFPLRAGLVVLMLLVTFAAQFLAITSILPTAAAVAIGVILLSWYAYE